MSHLRSTFISLGALSVLALSSNAFACGGDGESKPKPDDGKKPSIASMLCGGDGESKPKPDDGKKPSVLCGGDGESKPKPDDEKKKPSLFE
jgi:hypothetical protein